MAAQLLTDVLLRTLKPKVGRQVEVFDSKVPGLGIRISPGGTKAFVLWYRAGRRGRRLTLGRYPLLSLAEARRRAQEALQSASKGGDPAAEKVDARDSYDQNLFPAVVDEFIAKYARRKTRSWRETERLLKREFAQPWKRLLVSQIARRDVNKLLDAIVARGSPSAANHSFAAVRKLFSWCVERGYIEHSPCFGIRAPSKFTRRDRVLSDDELQAIWIAAGKMGYPFGCAVQLLILTGQRRGEVMGMRWPDIDLTERRWIIAGERNKSGRDHIVPLTDAAIDMIKALPRVHDELVFPARGKDSIASGFSKWKRALDEECGVKLWHLHDVRRTVATRLAEIQVPPHIIERVLNHTTGTLGGVAGTYNRFGYLPEMRAALQVWSENLQRLISARTQAMRHQH